MTYLTFLDRGTTASGKTRVFDVINTARTPLGSIRWVTGWRRYCFFPIGEPYFDAGCLTEIADKLVQLMKDRQ